MNDYINPDLLKRVPDILQTTSSRAREACKPSSINDRLRALGFVFEPQLGGGCCAWFRYHDNGESWDQIYTSMLDADPDDETYLGTFDDAAEEPRDLEIFPSLEACVTHLEPPVVTLPRSKDFDSVADARIWLLSLGFEYRDMGATWDLFERPGARAMVHLRRAQDDAIVVCISTDPVAGRRCPSCGALCDDPDWLSCYECGEPLGSR